MTGESRVFIAHHVPLGDGGERAVLRLPADMTEQEAERLCGVIRSLALSGDSSNEKEAGNGG